MGDLMKIPAIIIAATVALSLTGCASIANKAAEKAVEGALSSDGTNVDIEDGKVKIDSSEGSMEIGTGSELPADWPSDVPVPGGFAITGSMANSDTNGKGFTVTMETDGDKTSDIQVYVDNLTNNGWKLQTDMQGMYSLTKGKVQLDIISGFADGKTSAVMSVGPQSS